MMRISQSAVTTSKHVYNHRMQYVRVAVNLPAISGEYDYHLPVELEGRIQVGHLLQVPFGNQLAQGVVLQLLDQPSIAITKPVQELLDPSPVLTPLQIELARQLSAHTLNSMAAIIDLMIPPGLSQHADSLLSLTVTAGQKLSGLSEVQTRLMTLLQSRGALRGRQIDNHFQRVEWRKYAKTLQQKGLLQIQSILPPPSVRPKFIRTAQLAVPPEQAQAAMSVLGKTPATLERRQKALQFLIKEPEAVAVSWVYAESGCNAADLQELAERELIVLLECEIFRDPLRKFDANDQAGLGLRTVDMHLTSEQELAFAEILRDFQPRLADTGAQHPPFLLVGVTGSGKTEIYLQATAEAIRRGKTAIILVPEISITPQIVRRFLAYFPGQVGLVHSQLSDGERYDTWRRARSGQLKLIIGPRSALFLPLPNLGLIVVDECHDNSYYQSDPPFYNAVTAAEIYAKIGAMVCILGSATPSVELAYRSVLDALRAGSQRLRRLELKRRFQTSRTGGGLGELPTVSIVDMREEIKTGNRGIFSRSLMESLAETLQRGEQAILYLNRRGTSTYVFCRDCGYVVKCPQCDSPLTYHTGLQVPSKAATAARPGGLFCHRCGYSRQLPVTCPACKGNQIKAFGLGSEKVESDLKTLLPSARVMRWDWETTREKDAHEMIMMHFANHQADFLVGTQMLAKGLDLPLVTLVGIVLADVGLTIPDPFAPERSFQLLTQVSGRAGRSMRGGKVIMQTFMPNNPIIQMAAGHDFDAFYQWDLKNRRDLGYPPFSRLLRLEFRHADNAIAEAQARLVADKLREWCANENRKETSFIGPVPCFFARENGIYRWQIVIRAPDPASLVRGRIPQGCRVELDPVSLL